MDRSKSYAGGRMQIEPYYGGGGARPDFRSYSYSAGGGGMSSYSYQYEYGYGGGAAGAGAGSAATTDGDLKRSKYSYQYEYGYGGGAAGAGAGSAATTDGDLKRSKSKRRWLALGDPDMERKRRVAAYKAYAVEGKVKGSFRKSFKWIKDRYLHLVYGWS